MTKTRKRERRRALEHVDLGNAVAEADRDLDEYYVANRYLDMATDSSDRRIFFLGDKGVGKSALLEMAGRQLAGPKIIKLGAGQLVCSFVSAFLMASLLYTNARKSLGVSFRDLLARKEQGDSG